MDKHLIGFITKKGNKHLGYYTPIVNPCADHWEPNCIVKMYTDESGNEFKDVKEDFPICEIPLYVWDEQSDSYQLLSAPTPSTLAERMSSLFSEDLVTEDKSLRKARLWMIREWLYINTKCSQPVYIDKDNVIRSEGEIVINADALSQIPDYIIIQNK